MIDPNSFDIILRRIYFFSAILRKNVRMRLGKKQIMTIFKKKNIANISFFLQNSVDSRHLKTTNSEILSV